LVIGQTPDFLCSEKALEGRKRRCYYSNGQSDYFWLKPQVSAKRARANQWEMQR
jgi:hypothetical protein